MPDGKKKIFISWSKTQSKRVALVLKKYFPEILEGVELFVSDKDIGPGERSMKVLERELDGTTYGIAVVTDENQSEPWLNFEAGALSKAVGNDEQGLPYVVPLLVDIANESQLTGPISQFQAVQLDHDGIAEIIDSISTLIGTDKDIALIRFERAWPDMSTELTAARQTEEGVPTRTSRPLDEKVDEALEILRTVQRALPTPPDLFPLSERIERDKRRLVRRQEETIAVASSIASTYGFEVKGAIFDGETLESIAVVESDDTTDSRELHEDLRRYFGNSVRLDIQRGSAEEKS